MKKTYQYSDLIQLFEEAVQRAEQFKSIPPEIIQLKPNPSTWSTGEIFEHIVRFNRIYLRSVDRTLDTVQHRTTDKPEFSPRRLMNYFINTVRPPYKMKIKTIKPMKPQEGSAEEIFDYLDQLMQLNHNMIQQIYELGKKKLDLDLMKGENPVFKFNMTLTEFFLMMDAHQQRHFWQAGNILKKLTGESY